MSKVFVGVTVRHNKQGQITPLIMHWHDGRQWLVDRVLDVRQAASQIAGGLGTRYICRIAGKQVYLFHDEDKWFIEGK